MTDEITLHLRGRHFSYYGFDDEERVRVEEDAIGLKNKKETLAVFDEKVVRLKVWCEKYEAENGKWPSIKTVFEAQLDGFKSSAEVQRIMSYINSLKEE